MPPPLDASAVFAAAIAGHQKAISSLQSLAPAFERAAAIMTERILGGKKILWCGNGGSAADSQHLAAELVGRFRRNRRGLPSIALTTDSSILTAVGNDHGFETIFRRQVEALASPGDVLVGITTSGGSRNVCLALEQARAMDVFTVSMTGEEGGEAARLADLALCAPSRETARIQEVHILLGHILCDWIELNACAPASAETIAQAAAR